MAVENRRTVPKGYPWYFLGEAKSSDYTLTEDDLAIGIDTSGGDVVLTVLTASTVERYPRSWFTKKMTSDANRLVVSLQTQSDSMYGSQFHSMRLDRIGQGIEITLNANGLYTFSDWSGLEDAQSPPVVSTQQPSLVTTTLTMYGTLEDLGAETSVDVYFRHRDVTAGGAWIETSKVSKNSTGPYSDTATVTAGNVFDVQAMVDDSAGFTYYGSVLQTTSDYYQDTTEASMDGLERYWSMQEAAGTDTAATETMVSDTMSAFNGVTIGSDVINANTIYKRIFGPSDYMEAPYSPSIRTVDYTFLIQIDMNSNSGDHTILNFGRNRLSLASDDAVIQLEVQGYLATWVAATPFSSILNLFITVDHTTGRTTLYECNSAVRTQRAQQSVVPNRDASYTRVGRGANGDANHQDTEYMDDGQVRSVASWNRVLTEAEMMDISNVLDNDGELIVT